MKIILVLCIFAVLTSCSSSSKEAPTMGNFFLDEVSTSSPVKTQCWVKAGQEVKTVLVRDGVYEVTPISPTEECPDGKTVSIPVNKVRRMREATRRLNTNRMIKSDQREEKGGACELFEGAVVVKIFTTDFYRAKNMFVVGRNPHNEDQRGFACPVGDRLVISNDDERIF